MGLYDVNPVEDALRNPLILNRIFSFLPTKFLLNHSSLVNKLWCEESRKFIRDYRKCIARISHKSKAKPFAMNLIRFNDYLSEAKTTVAYNGISFVMNKKKNVKRKRLWCCFNPSHPGSCHSEDEYDKLCQIINSRSSSVKLKYISVALEPADCLYCSKHYISMAKLLRSLSKKLEHLKIIRGSSLLTRDVYLMSGSTVFPKLQTLEMSSVQANEEMFRKIINSSPNLKKIIYEDIEDSKEILRLLPPEKLHLLKNLRLEISTVEDEEMYKKLCDFGPALEIVDIIMPHAEDPPQFRANFRGIVNSLFMAGQKSVKRMSVAGESSQILTLFESVLESPSLVSLSELFVLRKDMTERGLCTLVRGIDFDRLFPSLERIILALQAFFPNDNEEDYGEDDDEAVLIQPEGSYSSSSVKRIDLESDSYRNINFSQLAQTFPAVTSLQVKNLSADNLLPLSQVIRSWPDLENIHLDGRARGVWRNYDSEFCGTSPEEMEYLWGQSPEFLREFHLVPIGPCLSTLAKLRRLDINVESQLAPTPLALQPQCIFISEVTQLLVLSRLPLLQMCVKLHYTGTSVTVGGTYRPTIIDLKSEDWRRDYVV